MSWLQKTVFNGLIFLGSFSQAATYYVSTSGSNTNSGSQAKPWRTVAYAVSKMVAGDTTYVHGGIYQEGEIRFSRSGTSTAPIKLLSVSGQKPVIDFRHVGKNMVIFQEAASYLNDIGHITIEGFEVRNGHHGMVMYNGYNINIRRNWIHDNAAQGLHGNGKNILVDRNVINHNGGFASCTNGGLTSIGTTICNQHHGIYATGPNWVITNNLIYDNLANGIVVAGYPNCPQGYCASKANAYKKTYTDDSYGGASGWLIANNTIAYNNYRDAIVLWLPLATKSKIINNIFYENSQKFPTGYNGITFFESAGGGHEIRNNLCYATNPGATACIAPNGQGKYTASGNIVNTLNPKFVNAPATMPSSPNFMLTASSPAINKGLTTTATKTDFLGRARQGVYDIGAYEYFSGSNSLSVPTRVTSFRIEGL